MSGDRKNPKLFLLIAWIVFIILVCTVFLRVETYGPLMRSLDNRKNTVAALTGASAAASAIVTTLPGDVATPIADKIADISFICGIITAVLLAEKYLLPFTTLIGAFLAMIALTILVAFPERENLQRLMFRFFVIAVALSITIPSSVLLSDGIELIFHNSIDESVNKVLLDGEIIKEESKQNQQDNRNVFQKAWGAISGWAGSIVKRIKNDVKKNVETAKRLLGTFMEAAVILVVTNCIIPMLVLIAYLAIIKWVFKWDYEHSRLYVSIQERIKRIFYN